MSFEAKELVYFHSKHAISHSSSVNARQFDISPDHEVEIFMSGVVVNLEIGERLFYASQNGILIHDQAKRLVFLRVGDQGKIERQDVSALGEHWDGLDALDKSVANANFTQGRVAVACGRADSIQKCVAWTSDGLIGDPHVPGSAFADEDAKHWQGSIVVNVAGWAGIGVAFQKEGDLVFGSFVVNEKGLLSFVERLRTKGDASASSEITQGEILAVGDTLRSWVSDGVWVLQNGAPPAKRVHLRDNARHPDFRLRSGYVQGSAHFSPSYEESGYEMIVLPHFAYE